MNKNKMASAIAMFLVMTFAISLVALPAANAQGSKEMTSYAFIDVAPNPIGVGQTVYISFWVDVALPQAAITNNIRRMDYTLTITSPTGKTDTKHWDFVADSTGIQFISYVPTEVGTYTFKFDYGGQTYTWNDTSAMRAWTGVKFLPATKTAKLTVQQEQLPPPLGSYPLPTEYWTRPIEGQNTNWYTITSQWMRGAQFGTFQMSTNYNLWQRDGTGPSSPHIMWTMPIEFGGVVGGTGTGVNGATYYSGGSYEGRFATSIIMNGFLYFKMPKSNNAATSGSGAVGSDNPYVCVDLRTGEIKWQNAAISPSFGSLEWFDSPNQHGVIPSGYLWQTSGSTWMAYSGFDGNWLFNITDVPSGKDVTSSAGELTRYVLNYNRTARSGSLALWNFTQVLTNGTLTSGGYRPVGLVYNSTQRNAYSWNVTITADLSGLSAPTIHAVLPGDVILGYSSSIAPSVGSIRSMADPYTVWALSDKPESRGQLLWIRNYTAPAGNISRNMGPLDPVNRVWMMEDGETMQWVGYSLEDGSLKWGPTTTVFRDMQFFGSGEGMGQRGVTAYGNLYVQGFSGELFAYSTKDGSVVWKFNKTDSGQETPWGLRPIFIAAIADGKVYAFNNEHSPNSPYYKDNTIYCLNATTGEEIYRMLGWSGQSGGQGGSTSILADGFLTYYNYYDNQVYSIGKGPSATAVTASPKVTAFGSSVVIEGTVMDTASGTKQKEQAARFPEGVPAVSDASMSGWMEYVYMQKPRPTNATGVEVTLSVLDSNNNYRDIGKTTTNTDGFFTFAWKPDIEGQYTVYASFAGSNSYWPSHAVSSFAVDPAPVAPAETVIPPDNSGTYATYSTIAIIVAIAVVGAIIVLVVRKRP
jgi:PQQ-like domain